MPATAPFALATDPTQLIGMNTGANIGGGSTAGFLTPSPTTSMGGSTNPFTPGPMPSGSSMSSIGSPGTTPAPGQGNPFPAFSSPFAGANNLSGVVNAGINPNTGPWASTAKTTNPINLAKGYQSAGYEGAVGNALAAFIQGGAGYNPAVAQAIIASLQPQFAANQANLMEQFGAQGLGAGSPAALGLASLGSQETLDVGTILSQLYESSVQNYMQTLIAGKGEPHQQGGGILGGLGSLLGGIGGASTGGGGTVFGDILGAVGL